MNRFRHLPSYHYEDNLDGNLKKSVGKKLRDYKVYGDSVQQGKNLIPYPYYQTSRTTNGVTFTINADGSVTVNGTATANTTFILTSTSAFVLPIGKYVVSGCPEDASNSNYYMVWQNKSFVYNQPATVNLTTEEGVNIYISVKAGVVCDNVLFKPQIELGSEATEYVPPLPTPDNPIEIESVGDRTKNYIDINHLGNISNWDAVPVYASYEMSLPNGNYYFNFETELESYSGHILFLSKKKSTSSSPVATLINGYNGIQAKQGSFTISDNEKIYLNWHCGSRNQTNLTKLVNDVLNNFIIEPGDTFTGYEPYGYKIPIKVTSTIYDFTLDNIKKHIYNQGGSIRYGFDLGVLEEGQYTIDLEYETVPTYLYLREKALDNTYSTQYITTTASEKPKLPLTFNANGTSNYYVIFASSGIDTDDEANDYWTKVKRAYLQKGTETKKEITNIYLNEPLRRIGDYADYIDFEKKKIIRNIYKGIVSLANLQAETSERYDLFSKTLNYYQGNRKPKLEAFGTGTYLLEKNAMDIAKCYAISYNATAKLHWLCSTNYAHLIAPKEQTVGEYFTENADLYPNGWKFQYVLNEPIEETIELPTILTNKGTNIIEIDTTIQPSAVQYQYYKGGK